MKYVFLPALCLFFYPFCLPAKDALKWEDDTPAAKIEAGGLFRKTEDPDAQNSKNTPDGSTAREIAVDDYRFQWRPRWNFTGLGGAILPFVLESSDESTLGIVETLPQTNAPSSSIIVFLNLRDFAIINYTVMPGKDVRRFCFVPFSSAIICLIKAPCNKYYPEPKFQLAAIDTRNAQTVAKTPASEAEPLAFCSNGKSLFAAFRNSRRIRVYDAARLAGYTTLQTVDNPALLECSPDGKKLLAVGDGKIQFFAVEQEIVPEKEIALPAFFKPDKIVPCAADASEFLLSVLGGDTYFYNGAEFIKICKRTDADIAWSAAENFIVVGQLKDAVIAFYKSAKPDSPEMEFKFQKLHPATNDRLLKIIPLPGKNSGIAVLDQRGALYHFTRKRNKWQKSIIIEQPKPL